MSLLTQGFFNALPKRRGYLSDGAQINLRNGFHEIHNSCVKSAFCVPAIGLNPARMNLSPPQEKEIETKGWAKSSLN